MEKALTWDIIGITSQGTPQTRFWTVRILAVLKRKCSDFLNGVGKEGLSLIIVVISPSFFGLLLGFVILIPIL